MVEIFSNFVSTAVFFGVVLGLGIIFEKQLISFEEKFDEWFEGVKNNVRKQKEVKSSR
jgi:hypothetical protein